MASQACRPRPTTISSPDSIHASLSCSSLFTFLNSLIHGYSFYFPKMSFLGRNSTPGAGGINQERVDMATQE